MQIVITDQMLGQFKEQMPETEISRITTDTTVKNGRALPSEVIIHTTDKKRFVWDLTKEEWQRRW